MKLICDRDDATANGGFEDEVHFVVVPSCLGLEGGGRIPLDVRSYLVEYHHTVPMLVQSPEPGATDPNDNP